MKSNIYETITVPLTISRACSSITISMASDLIVLRIPGTTLIDFSIMLVKPAKRNYSTIVLPKCTDFDGTGGQERGHEDVENRQD